MAFALFERSPSSGLGNIRRSYGEPRHNIDWVLMVAVGVQTAIGAVIVYSATRPRLLNRGADPFYFLQRQVIFVIFAAAILAFIMWLDYGGQLRGNAGLLYVGTIILLVLVLVAGAATGGARLSFNLGPVSLQPSEFAKVATLLLLAGFLADDDSDSVSYERFIQGLMLVGLPAALITVEPDLGSASVLVACAMGVMLVAGARMRNIVFVTSLAIVSVTGAVAAGVVSNYQLRRITAFFNQNSDETRLQSIVYQVRFAKRAVANGGLFGKGYLKGPLTNGAFIPVQSTDFVFSAIGEQFGLVGCLIVLIILGVILWRVFRIAQMAKDRFGRFLCAGVFTMILWQSFQNIGMTMGLMPVTGVPLPFVSYGGSHTVAFAIMVGIVQNVHMRRFR